MCGDEHTPMVELHEPAIADDLDGLAGQPHVGPVGRGGEAGGSFGRHSPRRHWLGSSFGLRGGLVADRRHSGFAGEAEPVPRSRAAEGLVGSLVVVAPHPCVELGLGIIDHGCHLVRTRLRLRRLIHQTHQPTIGIAPQPPVHRLTGHPVAASHIGHRRTIVEDLERWHKTLRRELLDGKTFASLGPCAPSWGSKLLSRSRRSRSSTSPISVVMVLGDEPHAPDGRGTATSATVTTPRPRQLNAALHRIALTQAHWHPDARALVARRKANGDSGHEALRVLKRRLSDVVYGALITDAQHHLTPAA